jgi:hypothetical protein
MASNRSPRSRLALALPLIALMVFVLACGSSTDQVREASQAAAPTAQISVTLEQPTTQQPAAAEAGAPTIAPTTEAPLPTDTPQAPQLPLEIQASGFGQQRDIVSYAFVLQNPNAGAAIESSQYQIAAYDSAGTVLKTDSGYVELVLPGEKTGVAGSLFLPENTEASRVEVQLKTGRFEPSEPLPNFSVEKLQLQPDDTFPKVTALINSPYARDIDMVRVAAVVYDETGKIIGGGFTFLNFALANAQAPVAVSVAYAGAPAKVELYPAITSLSSFTEQPAAAVAQPAITTSGFGGERNSYGFGFIAENPSSDTAFESTPYQAALLDAEGNVLAVDEGYIELLLPGQKLGVADSMYVPEGTTPAKLTVALLARKPQKTEPLPAFTTENVSFKPDDYSPKATGIIKSPYNKDVKNLRVSALAYDDTGNIIGGGFTFVDFVPANGQAAVDVSITASGTPARVELHPTLSGLSSFE